MDQCKVASANRPLRCTQIWTPSAISNQRSLTALAMAAIVTSTVNALCGGNDLSKFYKF